MLNRQDAIVRELVVAYGEIAAAPRQSERLSRRSRFVDCAAASARELAIDPPDLLDEVYAVLANARAAADRAPAPWSLHLRAHLGRLQARGRSTVAAWRCRVGLRRYDLSIAELADRARSRSRDPAAPLFSIVILSCGRLEYLRHTLAGLVLSDGGARWELIVVDNGSPPEQVRYLRACAQAGAIDKLLLSPTNRGISAGYNVGFAAADRSTSYYVKLDSDNVILDRGWMGALHAAFASSDAAIIALDQVNHPRLAALPALARDGRFKSWRGWVCGACAMTIPREIFDRFGCFSEDFDFAYNPDDADYYIRLETAGYAAYYLRSHRGYHQGYLDRSEYARVAQQKHQSATNYAAAMQRLQRAYFTGRRSIHRVYPEYDRSAWPAGARVVELGPSLAAKG